MRFFKILIVITIIFGMLDVEANKVIAEEVSDNLYELSPDGIEAGHDGFTYAKVGSFADTSVEGDSEKSYQMWSYEFGSENQGWTAYVPKGTRTLMLTGNLNAKNTLGVDTINNGVGIYKPARFYRGSYTGDIVDVQGSRNQSVFITTTGELWYTGVNTDRIFFDSTNNPENYPGYNKWNKYVPPSDVKVITDFVLADTTLFFIGETNDGESKLYVSGTIAANNSYASSTTYGTNRYLNQNYNSKSQHNLDITSELNGEIPERVFSQRSTIDYATYERWVIVETDKGYLGNGYTSETRRVTGILRRSGRITDNGLTSELSSRDYLGFNPIMYQLKPEAQPEIATTVLGAAPVERLPAKYIGSAASQGNDHIINFVGAKGTPIEGKIFTAGKSYFGNVTGTHYEHFRGWNNNLTDFTFDNTRIENASKLLNRWTTGYFSENDAWGNDNSLVYSGVLGMTVKKTDGHLVSTSEVGSSSGALPSISPDKSDTNYGTKCLVSTSWCFTNAIIEVENNDYKPWFQSTNWNKTEDIRRGQIITLWNGAMTVDQDDYLRITAREKSYSSTAFRTQLSFPVVEEGISTIRTKTLAGEGLSNHQYFLQNYDNTVENNRNNVRVAGEYMLVKQYQVVDPTIKFDGTSTSDNISTAVSNTRDDSYNPFNITIGEPYSRKYTLNEDGSASSDAKFFVDYRINSYDPINEEITGSAVLMDNRADVTDQNVNVDLSSLEPGWYQVRVLRYTTIKIGDGVGASYERYESSEVKEVFYVSDDLTIKATSPLEITKDSDDNTLASSVSTLVRPNTSFNDKVYIDSSSIDLTKLGEVTYKDIDTNNLSKPVDVKVTNFNQETIGVHEIVYKINHSDGNTYSFTQTLIVSDGSFEYDDNYIIKADDFTMTYSKFSDEEDDLKAISNLELWKNNGSKYEVQSDLSEVAVSKDKFVNQEGLDTTITFNIGDINKTVSAKVDNKPVISFSDTVLAIKEADRLSEDALKVSMEVSDKDGDDVVVVVNPPNAKDFVSGGLYIIEYKVSDSRGNETVATRYAFLDDGVISVGENYIVSAKDYELRVSEVPEDDVMKKNQATLKSELKIYAHPTNYNAENIGQLSIDIEFEEPEYTNSVGQYGIVFKIKNDDIVDTTTKVNANVMSGQPPVISGNDFYVVNLNDNYDFKSGIIIKDDYASQDYLFENLKVDKTITDQTEPGIYNVTYTTLDEDGNKSNEFVRTVLVNDGNYVDGDTYFIYATDFNTNLRNAKIETLFADANVKLYEKSGGNLVSNDDIEITYGSPSYNDVNGVGKYMITFSHKTDSKTSITINANVFDDGLVIGNEYGISANDFNVDINELEGINIIKRSGATAIKLVDRSDAELSVKSNDIEAEVGSYKVVLNVVEEESTQKEITVTVKDSNTVIGTDYALRGNNFKITDSDVASLSDGKVIQSSNAKAWKISDNTDALVSVDYSNVKSDPGVYLVTLNVNDDSEVEKSIYVTVTSNNSVTTSNDEYLLVASSFIVDLTKQDKLPTSQEEIFKSASVKVYNTSDGSVIGNNNVSSSLITMEGYSDGLYGIDFTIDEAELKINALVIDSNSGSGDSLAIVSNDIFIDKRGEYDSSLYDSSSKLVNLSNTLVIDKSTLMVTDKYDIVSNPSSFATQGAGRYNIQYNVVNEEINAKANVYVYDSSSAFDEDNNIVINGFNFIITSENAKTITKDKILISSDAHAFNSDTKEFYSVIVNSEDIKELNEGIKGVYQVRLSVDGFDIVKTIYVTVTSDDGVLTTNGDYLVTASDFTIDLTNGDVLPTTIDEFVKASDLKIISTKNGEVLNDLNTLNSNPTTMSNYSDGLYDIKFIYKGATLTVKALVIDDDSGVNGNLVIVANNLVIDKRSYNSEDYDSSDDIVSKAKVNVVNSDTYEVDTTKLIISNPSSFVDYKAGKYLTSYTSSDLETTAYVYVIDESSVVTDNGLVINASNFKLDSESAKVLTAEKALDYADAVGFNKETGEEFELTVDSLKMIKTGTANVYALKVVSKDDKSVFKTVYVTVTSDNGVLTTAEEYLVIANDFTIDLTKGDTLPTNVNKFVEASDIEIISTLNGEKLGTFEGLTVDPSSMANYRDGLYDVKYAYDGAMLTVKSIVIDNTTGVSEEVIVVANDFVIDKRNDSSDDYDSSEDIVSKARAKVIDRKTYEIDETKTIETSPSSFVTHSAGKYITYYSVSDVSATSYVYVIDESSLVDEESNLVINASNFKVDSINAKQLNNVKAIALANASAFDKEFVKEFELEVNKEQLDNLKKGVGGVYPLSFKVAEFDVVKTIYVTVTSDDSVLTTDGDYLVVANDFTIDLNKGDNLPSTVEGIVKESLLMIISTRDGEVLSDITGLNVNPNSMASYRDGLYDVEFNYNGANVIVNALVIDEDSGVSSELVIVANNFVIDKRDYNSEDYDSSEDIVRLAKSNIINSDTYEIDVTNAITSKPSSFVDYNAGKYVTSYTSNDLETKAYVYVIDESSEVDEESGIVINASNFTLTSDEAVMLTKDEVVDKSKATAFNVNSLEEYKVIVDETTLNSINSGNAGVYALDISVEESSLVKTIFVTVTSNNSIITSDGEYLIVGNSFVVDLTIGDVLPTTIEHFVDYGNVVITSTSNGEVLNDYTNLTVSPISMNGYEDGLYDVGYSFKSGDEENVLNVKAVVIDSTTGIIKDDENTYTISASDFIIDRASNDYNELNYDSLEDIKVLSNVKVIDLGNFEEVDNSFLQANYSEFVSNDVGDYILEFTSTNIERNSSSIVRIIQASQYQLSGNYNYIHIDSLNNTDLKLLFNFTVEKTYQGSVDKTYDVNEIVLSVDGNTDLTQLEVGVHKVDVVLDDLSTSVYLTVFDDMSVIDNNKVLLLDNTKLRFTSDVAKDLTFEDILNLSNARAFDMTTGEQIPVMMLSKEVVEEIFDGNVGNYTIRIKANPEAEIYIEVVDVLPETGRVSYVSLIIIILAVLILLKMFMKEY